MEKTSEIFSRLVGDVRDNFDKISGQDGFPLPDFLLNKNSFNNFFLDHLLHFSDIGFLILYKGAIVYTNEFFTRLTGYSLNELRLKMIDQLVHNDYVNIIDEYMRLISKKKSVNGSIQVPLNHKNNFDIWLEIRGNSHNWQNKKMILLTAFDITKRKKAEKDLFVSELKSRCLIEAIPDNIFVFDDDGKITDFIPASEKQSRLSKEYFTGKFVYEIFDSKVSKIIIDHINETLCSRKISIFEYDINTNDTLNYFEGRMIPYNSRSVMLIARDITHRKKVEDKLAESEDHLKKLNQAKDKLFSIIAHDLKNPFNNIIGFCNLLIKNSKRYDFDKIHEIHNLMLFSSQTGYNLLENLLEWSRSQSGKLNVVKVATETGKLINDNLRLISSAAHNKKIDIVSDIVEQAYIYADANMISTVIRNLLSNAVKFTPEGGKIYVTSSVQDEKVIISIEDTGIGINPEQVQNMFKIDKSISTRGTYGEKGTGLGLIICKEFIDKNDGILNVESESGTGTLFSITFPAYNNS